MRENKVLQFGRRHLESLDFDQLLSAIDNFHETQEFRLPDLLRDHGIVSLVNVPVMINGLTWGVLEVDSKPRCFDEWDITFLSTLANMMGTCIVLHEALQKSIEERAQRERDRAQSDIVLRELQHRIKKQPANYRRVSQSKKGRRLTRSSRETELRDRSRSGDCACP